MGPLARARGGDRIAVELQDALDREHDRLPVVDDQEARHKRI
jgi:hypothetical protein